MKKIILLMILGVFLFGCPDFCPDCTPPENTFKGIHFALVPEECTEVKDDVCGLYSCMTINCWCEQSPDQILVEGDELVIGNEKDAMKDVQEYLNSINSDYEVKRAVELNSVFYNVFAENDLGEEKAFTIAVDGTIIKTQCGV